MKLEHHVWKYTLWASAGYSTNGEMYLVEIGSTSYKARRKVLVDDMRKYDNGNRKFLEH